MLLASTTRSIMLVYVGVLAFFVLWIVAGKFTQNIDNEWIAVLTDPFGIRALGRATRYFSTAEANAGLPDFGRLHAGQPRALGRGRAGAVRPDPGAVQAAARRHRQAPVRQGQGAGPGRAVPAHIALPRIEPRFTGATRWVQCWHIFAFDAAAVFRSVPFLVMLLFGVLNLVGSRFADGQDVRHRRLSDDPPDGRTDERQLHLHAAHHRDLLRGRADLQGAPGQDRRRHRRHAGAELGAAAGQEPGAGGRRAGLPVHRRPGRDGDPAGQGRRAGRAAALPQGRPDLRPAVHPHGPVSPSSCRWSRTTSSSATC
jgi:hypothetical protein